MSTTLTNAERPLDTLERALGANWSALRKARGATARKQAELAAAFQRPISPDTSLVLFGSIARDEMTSGSDADWILLVDGQSTPEHQDGEDDTRRRLIELGLPKPGASGVFGKLVGSHDIVHKIGGEDDTNSNTTRRVLLLLESLPVGDRAAYDRVRRQILNRYVRDDRGLSRGRGQIKIPRFLLNDLTRYWRTITVDFVYKQRVDAGRKWALRNLKLRMSRKLIFASGLLRCFFCELDPAAEEAREALRSEPKDTRKLLAYMEQQLARTPLDILAQAAARPGVDPALALRIFSSYDRFLATLDDERSRHELADMQEDQMPTSAVWTQVRQFSSEFHSGIIDLFFRSDEQMRKLSEEFGVF